MRYRAVRHAERYIGLAVLAGISGAANAQQQALSTAVFVSTGGSVETNPYNSVNAGAAGIAATAEIRPTARWRGELSTLEVTGLAQFRQFSSQYGLEDNYGLTGNMVTRVSERVTVRTNGGFSYNEGGFNNFARPGLLPGVPTNPDLIPDIPDPSLIDPTVLGQRVRTKSFNMAVGASTQLGMYSSLSLDVTGRANRFAQQGFGDFNSVSGQLNYSHQLSEQTSAGVILGLTRTDYTGTRIGDATTTSVMGSINHRLGDRWTLSGAAGLAITKIQQTLGLPDDKFNALTAQISFCRQGQYGRFCLNGSRAPEPSGAGNVRVNNTLAADYSHRLSERETMTVSGSYAHTGRGRGVANIFPAVEFYAGALRYDNQIRNNLTFFTGTNFSKVNAPNAPRGANFGVNAGLQIRFGALQ